MQRNVATTKRCFKVWEETVRVPTKKGSDTKLCTGFTVNEQQAL
jgi:hypothetical protein